MPNVVLGVSGSVAAYRACDLARELMRRGYGVRVCLTDAAQGFVTPALFEALTGQPCLEGVFDEPVSGRMAHIDWAREADVLLVAPATANTLCKLAQGIADDMLNTIAVAFRGPLVIAPAMNPTMFASDPVRSAIDILKSRAAVFVEPDEGVVACGEEGQGKFAPIEQIANAVQLVTARSKLLQGKKVLLTSGPTQEPVDSVRFLSNRSSGKMGAALGRAALLLGAEVNVVSGPASSPLPLEATVHRVRTAQEMLDQALALVGESDLIIGAAAVADYRPAQPHQGKLRRSNEPLTMQFVPNPDIIAALASQKKPGACVIAFAAEPDEELETARQKIQQKGLDGVAINDISRDDIGFESDENQLTLLWEDGSNQRCEKQSKLGCALWLLEQIALQKFQG